MTEKDLLTLSGLAFMGLAHILWGKAQMIQVFERRGWISFSAGASVSYVFIHVLPEIGIFQQQITRSSGHHEPVPFLNQPLYLVALGGLCLLYMLDSIENGFREEGSRKFRRHKYYLPLLTLKSILYFLYNIMIAYIITTRPGQGVINITLITVALTLHFIVVNNGFQEVYGDLFARYVRRPAALGLFLGWILGVLIDLPDVAIASVFAFIGGMITYIALKAELPQTRHKAPAFFISGALIYALLALAIPFFGRAYL